MGLLAFAPLAVGILHLAEVHLADAAAGAWVRHATGWDFRAFARLEAPLTRAVEEGLAPGAVAALTVYYLAAFLLLLAAVPGLVASTGDARLLRRTLRGYPAIYALAVPFYLLFPSPNPYTAAGGPSPFGTVHPDLEWLYYLGTTRDNTFPSLHVAFTAFLVARGLQARLPALAGPMLATHGALLVASVVLLRVHYALDVAGGLLLALVALRLGDAIERRLGVPARPDARAAALDAQDAVVRDARRAAPALAKAEEGAAQLDDVAP
jgi:membrane-associated phospholipid phosphatase